MQKFHLLVFIILGQFVFAQEHPYIYTSPAFQFEKGTIQKVLVDKTNLRDTPNLEGKIITTLYQGQVVKVISETNKVLQLGKRGAQWYKVSFHLNGETKTGYIWGANLCIGYRHLDGYDFLFGASNTEKEVLKMEVKVLKDKKYLQSVFFDVSFEESLSFVFFKWLNTNKGLDGVENILSAMVSGEACGIPTYTQNMLWYKGRLKPFPLLMSVSDAGVFYHAEEFVFPNDKGGKEGQIILKIEESEVENSDEEDDEKWKYKTKKSEAIYHLDQNHNIIKIN
ncbi:MAG: peptide-binding protein [Flavobacteriales bacterium]|nr:MAG: peptide-binding protein [Flavobacteriales bacterium]